MSSDRSENLRSGLFRSLVVFFLLGFLLSQADAQGPSNLPEREPLSKESYSGESIPPRLRQAPLDAVVLFNPAGKTSIVLPGGWALEELDELYKFLLKDQQESTPSYTIQGLAAKGRVVGNRVETTLRIILTTSQSQTVRIPLGMKEGVLPFSSDNHDAVPVDQIKLPYRYTGPGSFDLIVNPQDRQYVAQIRPGSSKTNVQEKTETTVSLSEVPTPSEMDEEVPPPPEPPKSTNSPMTTAAPEPVSSEQRHELVLSLWFPLTRIGDEEQRLSISFPQAVSSQFLLTVPMGDAVATVSQGTLLDVLDVPDQRATQFNILGLKSNFDLSWRKKKSDPVEDRPILYVEEASVIARLENRSTVYDATLPIRSPSGSFDRLRIRLPQGAMLDHESTEKYSAGGGYSFRLLTDEERDALISPSNEESEAQRRGEASPIVEIQLPRKTSGKVDIRLRATQQHLSEKAGDWRDLGGFEVIGAERQFGFLSVGIPADMRPNWKPIRGIRRVDLPVLLAQEGIDARFEFYAQPFLLRSQIVLPQTRINVKPEYQVQINKGSLSLTARFSFVVHGSKTEKLALRLFDWQWSGDIGPSSVVDIDGVDQDESGLLTIPLRAASDGTFDIELKAHRAIPPDTEEKQRLVVRLPQPDTDTANWTEPAALVVVPADNVEVLPVDFKTEPAPADPPTVEVPEGESQRMFGLMRRARRSIPLRLDIPTRQQDPLIYQTETVGAVFVADILYHRQEIQGTIHTDIRLLDTEDQVLQTIQYDVAYEPVDKLFLTLPKSLSEREMSVLFGGRTLELRDVAAPSDEDGSEQRLRKRIMLPEALIGRFQLTLRYGMPPVPVKSDMTTTFSLPLVLPSEITVASHQVNVIVPPGVKIDLMDDVDRAWKPVQPSSGAETTGLRSPFGAAFQSTQGPEKISLKVELADRDALGTTVVQHAWLQTWLTDPIRIDHGIYRLTSDRDAVSLWLPSAVAKEKIIVRRDRVQIPVRLSPKGELTVPILHKDRPVLLEVWYQIPQDSERSVRMTLPHFGDGALVRSGYWQVLLPQNKHILGVPDGWTPEYRWGWNRLFWGRLPSIRMEDIGLHDETSETMPISTEANQYLFSSLHPESETSFFVADRAVIVLFSSSLSLLVGLILIYFPRTRYAGSLLGLAIALVAVLVYRPAPVLLMLQASAFGVVLALGAAYVYRILYREERWIVPHTVDWDDASDAAEVYSVIMDEESAPARKESATKKESKATQRDRNSGTGAQKSE